MNKPVGNNLPVVSNNYSSQVNGKDAGRTRSERQTAVDMRWCFRMICVSVFSEVPGNLECAHRLMECRSLEILLPVTVLIVAGKRLLPGESRRRKANQPGEESSSTSF